MDRETALIIRTELTLHGWSQAQIAERVGITKPKFSLLLNGHHRASPELVARIFHAIHRPIYEAGGLATAEPAALAMAGD